MSLRHARLGFLLGAFVFLTLSGCSSPKEVKVSEEDSEQARRKLALKEVFSIYDALSRDKMMPVAKFEDVPVETGAGYPFGYQAMQDGNILVYWGLDIINKTGSDDPVLAYEKDAPVQGGYVMLASGKLVQTTPDGFKTLPKPKLPGK